MIYINGKKYKECHHELANTDGGRDNMALISSIGLVPEDMDAAIFVTTASKSDVYAEVFFCFSMSLRDSP